MAETTYDHAAETMICVNAAWRATDQERTDLLIQAGVHATLALADVQRRENELSEARLNLQLIEAGTVFEQELRYTGPVKHDDHEDETFEVDRVMIETRHNAQKDSIRNVLHLVDLAKGVKL